jgi:antirestriction protein ArdC
VNLQELVTQKMIECLQQGTPPWRKTWGEGKREVLIIPRNPFSNKPYSGINVVLLWVASMDKGYASPFWGTRKSWEKVGATILPEQIPTTISAFFRNCEVYHQNQVSGFVREELEENCGSVENLVKNSEVTLVFGGSEAYYIIGTDVIHMPRRDGFESDEAYYTTLLHEMSHWTGGQKRLNRKFGNKGTKVYAFEELIAEWASCFTAAELGVPAVLDEMPNHASYINGWLEILEEDKHAVFKAAAEAQKATRFLLKLGRSGLCSRQAS